MLVSLLFWISFWCLARWIIFSLFWLRELFLFFRLVGRFCFWYRVWFTPEITKSSEHFPSEILQSLYIAPEKPN
jgi:hypothetical protein